MGPISFSVHGAVFTTLNYEWAHGARVFVYYIRLERKGWKKDKHTSLLSLFVGYEEN